jgi:hypothetical protein
MRRVRLPELPAEFPRILPAARALIADARDELLTPAGPPLLAAHAAD